jgi:hypothetical protein
MVNDRFVKIFQYYGRDVKPHRKQRGIDWKILNAPRVGKSNPRPPRNEPPRVKPRSILKDKNHFSATSCGELYPIDFAAILDCLNNPCNLRNLRIKSFFSGKVRIFATSVGLI